MVKSVHRQCHIGVEKVELSMDREVRQHVREKRGFGWQAEMKMMNKGSVDKINMALSFNCGKKKV